MKRVLIGIRCLVLVVAVSFCGCGEPAKKPVELEGSVRSLTGTLHGALVYQKHEKTPTGDELLEMAFNEDPPARKHFKGLDLQVRHNGKTVVLLVPSPDGHCWFEDSSDTPKVDRPCYKDDPPKPAEFTLVPDDWEQTTSAPAASAG